MNDEQFKEYVMNQLISEHVEGQFQKIIQYGEGILIITSNGTLYGLGTNSNDRFTEAAGIYCKVPFEISKHVRSAAISDHYVVYLTEFGEVKVIGSGKLADYFRGFSNARQVIGKANDVFYLEDQWFQWHGFGDNAFCRIAEHQEQVILNFPSEKTEVHYYAHQHDSTGRYGNWEKKIQENHIKTSARYTVLSKLYGEENLEIRYRQLEEDEFEKANRLHINHDMFYRDHVIVQGRYEADVILKNRWIYEPVSVEKPEGLKQNAAVYYDITLRKMCCLDKKITFTVSKFGKTETVCLQLTKDGEVKVYKGKKDDDLVFAKVLFKHIVFMTLMDQKLLMFDKYNQLKIGSFSESPDHYQVIELS